jgi:diguanylate cyclase (GGDEF)-like protein
VAADPIASVLDEVETPPKHDGNSVLRRVRVHLVVFTAVSMTIVMGMAVLWVSASVKDGGMHPDTLVQLAALAAAMSAALAWLARRTLRPVEQMADSNDRLMELYNRARLDALLDPLTGLGNHRAFQEELARQIETARRYNHSLALALVDLDDLKSVNDELGHAGGDGLLAAMGRLISTTIRTGDRGFRIGGDEFAILLPHADAEAATVLIHRLLAQSLGGTATRPGMPQFSFSAGISTFPALSGDRSRLYRQADAALYWSKRHGRTDVQVFDPSRHGAADDTRSTVELAAAVAKIAKKKTLSAVYQPIFDLATGDPIGYEGLVRPRENSGFSGAESLFVAAEATDRTVELDMACVEVVVANAHLKGAGQYLSLNISPRTLETEQFRVSDLLSRLEPHGIPPERIVVELTERESIADLDRLVSNLNACRAAGMRIAADDVGAGSAGLRLLAQVSFDIVKVDLALVQGGVLHDSALAVLRALRDLTDTTHAQLVAEGIETAEQLEVVRSLGFHAGQGYLLGYPGPKAEATTIDLAALARVAPQQTAGQAA